jgi:hypothetical protein
VVVGVTGLIETSVVVGVTGLIETSVVVEIELFCVG